MKLTRYSHTFELPSHPGFTCLFTFLEQGVAIFPTEVIFNIKSGRFDCLKTSELLLLSQIGALIDNDEQDADRLKYYFQKLPFANSIGKLTIITTFDCNLACYYCLQEDLACEKKYLEGDNLDVLKNWLPLWIRGNKLSEVHLEFIGGEPLLNIEAIRDVCDIVRSQNIKFEASLITNGTMLNENIIKLLHEYGVSSIQLTFDGPKVLHDQIKNIGNLKSSYDMAKSSIPILMNNGYRVTIRINYPQGKATQAIETAESLYDLKNKNKIVMSFSELFGVGCNDFYEQATNKHKEKLRLYAYGKDLGFLLPFPFSSIMCKAEADSNFTITPSLEIYKCYLLVGNKTAKIGKLTVEGITVDNYAELLRDASQECLKCKFFPLCRGGCKASKYINSGENNVTMCPIKTISSNLDNYLPLFVEANYADLLHEIN